MKCRLVQILAVAMLLGHTVAINIFEFLPTGLRYALKPTEITGKQHAILDGTRIVELTRSNGMKSIDTLRVEVATIKKQLATVNFAQFEGTNKEPVYTMINKLFEIRRHVLESTHEDRAMLREKIDKEIDVLVENLRKTIKDFENDITQNYMNNQPIKREVSNIGRTGSLSDVDIEFLNIDENTLLEQMLEKLVEMEEVFSNKIVKPIILRRMRNLLNHIIQNTLIQGYDTRDTQSMRNVIGISIAVCAIVTLCIVLLIAVRNKHRTNTGVRLFDRI